MPIKIQLKCLLCGADKIQLEEESLQTCDLCGASFEADSTCAEGHFVCHLCRQKGARESIMAHCLKSRHTQPFPLLIELMALPDVAMHGPEHHLLLTAALLTAYCNETGRGAELPTFLETANLRSMEVPGGACAYWGVCGAAIGSGIYMSILTESSPYAEAAWKTTGQLTARCADAVSSHEGPRCCKRDSFLSLTQAVAYSNEALGTHFALPEEIRCDFYPNNQECKRRACPFFPVRKQNFDI